MIVAAVDIDFGNIVVVVVCGTKEKSAGAGCSSFLCLVLLVACGSIINNSNSCICYARCYLAVVALVHHHQSSE